MAAAGSTQFHLSQVQLEVPEPEAEADVDAAAAAEVGAKCGSDAEDDDEDFDYKTLEEAQRLAGGAEAKTEGVGPEEGPQKKRKQRGGNKERQKKKKHHKREDAVLRAKQAGIPLLSDALRATLAKSAASAVASRRLVSYADVNPAGTDVPTAASSSSSSLPAANSATAESAAGLAPAAFARLARISAIQARRKEARNTRTVFVKNFSFKMTEKEIVEWLSPCGTIKEVKLGRDKVTTHSLGYAHVLFEEAAAAQAAVQRCDQQELRGRVVRVVPVGVKCEFELPDNIKEDIRAILRGDEEYKAYEGMNLSTVKDAWQKRHPGQKLDTSKWGFKNFSAAVATIEGVVLENHLEKKLTNLAFFRGSPAHIGFLEEKRRAQEEQARSTEAASHEGEDVVGSGASGEKRKAPDSGQSAPPAKRQHLEKDEDPSTESGAPGQAERKTCGCVIC